MCQCVDIQGAAKKVRSRIDSIRAGFSYYISYIQLTTTTSQLTISTVHRQYQSGLDDSSPPHTSDQLTQARLIKKVTHWMDQNSSDKDSIENRPNGLIFVVLGITLI